MLTYSEVDAVGTAIRQVLAEHGKLIVDADELADDSNLYGAGLSSHAAVNVMLALEEDLDVEFPDEALTKETFESIAAIRSVLCELVTAR